MKKINPLACFSFAIKIHKHNRYIGDFILWGLGFRNKAQKKEDDFLGQGICPQCKSQLSTPKREALGGAYFLEYDEVIVNCLHCGERYRIK